MAKRGMSLEDKRLTLLNIFHESKDVFLLKDVEKIGAKRGVVMQSIKDVLQALVDDDLVHQERIGISNYYWSFPSEAAVKLENERERLAKRLTDRQAESAALEKQLAAQQSRLGDSNSGERLALQAELDRLQGEVAARRGELAQYSANDPERYEAMKQACLVARDSANRWIDNIEMLRSWLRKRFQGNKAEVNSFFKEQGAGDEMDYLEI